MSEERRTLVAEWLQSEGAVTVTDLQTRFGVSAMTARRDLSVLTERGLARRAHGGAVLPSIAAGDHSFRQRLGAATDAKTRLAEAAFALLRPADTVFLDASSTTYYVARLIASRELGLRVITNSLPILQELSDSDVELVAIGGSFRSLTCSFVGPAAVRTVRDHFVDRMLMSVTGVTPDGVMTDVDTLEAEVKRAMLEQADQSALLLDESKLTERGRTAIASVSAVSLVLADGLDRSDIERLTSFGPPVQATKEEEWD